MKLTLNKFLLLTIPIFFILPKISFAAASGFELNYKDQVFSIDKQTLNSFSGRSLMPDERALQQGEKNTDEMLSTFFGQENAPQKSVRYVNYNLGEIYQYIKNLTPQINATTVEPSLKIENFKAVEFTPPQNGLKLDVYTSSLKVLSALQNKKSQSQLEVWESQTKTALSDTNDLGIKELISTGVSNFKGSPNNRVHNIKIGVEKMTGVIIKPGEEFSFNKYLGPVEEEQGFLPELVIKKTGTVPELGGGLCQVSSTTFRAAMHAGLPITQRRNHAYAVQYYAPQGTDATIYPGVVDLKFINDTPGAILIWPYIKDKYNLYFDFYGSKDSRIVTLEKPVQYDRQANGAMKATWTREVFNNGTTTTDTFKSTYLSPELFHKPTATSTASSNTAPAPASLN